MRVADSAVIPSCQQRGALHKKIKGFCLAYNKPYMKKELINMNWENYLTDNVDIIFFEKFNKMTEAALRSQNDRAFNNAMSGSFIALSGIVDFDSVVIYHRLNVNSCKRFSQVYRWNKTEFGTILPYDDINVMPDLAILPNLALIESWTSALSKNSVVNISTDSMSEEETVFLGISGVKSILLVPVLINDELWGCIAFQEHTGERFFCKRSTEFLSLIVCKSIKNVLTAQFTEEMESNFIADTESNICA